MLIELSQLSNEELLKEAKKIKSESVTDAIIIGFLIGIIIYSVVNKSVGMLTLIPVYFAYKLTKKPRYKKEELTALLKERNLKL